MVCLSTNARSWLAGYVAVSTLLALTYALIGVILAPLFGRVAGVLVAFLIPFLDLGIAQDPMLHAAPPAWAHLLPGYGGFRSLTNAILTPASPRPARCWPRWPGWPAPPRAPLLFGRNMRTARSPGPARPGAKSVLTVET
jgi:hypothetical protein